MSEMWIWTMFAIANMMNITGVVVSKKSTVQNKQQFRKVSKHFKSYIHCVRNVGNDNVSCVCHS